jgi:single-stranded DNA-binding protein
VVSISISGKLISEISIKTSSGGGERAEFKVQSDDQDRDSLPLHFTVVGFGGQAKRAATLLRTGTSVNLFGRMTASSESKQVTVRLLGFEVHDGAKTNGN